MARVQVGAQGYWFDPATQKWYTSKTAKNPIPDPYAGGTIPTQGPRPGTVVSAPKPEPLPALPETPTTPGEGTPDPGTDPGAEVPPEDEMEPEDRNYFEDLIAMLDLWGLSGLRGLARRAIVEDWNESRLIREVRNSDIYKTVFPEQELRLQAGLGYLPESQIIANREQYRKIAADYGVAVGLNDTAALIAGQVSPTEWAHRLDVYQKIQERGDGVRWVFSEIAGVTLDDDTLWKFFDPEFSTPEIDRMYEDALYRGLPAMLEGVGIRPQEEADTLRAMGINPEEAFAGYQKVAGQLPTVTKLKAIQAFEAGQDSGPTGNDLLNNASRTQLIAAFLYNDPTARRELTSMLIQDAADWRAGGGPARSQQGALSGLISPDRR